MSPPDPFFIHLFNVVVALIHRVRRDKSAGLSTETPSGTGDIADDRFSPGEGRARVTDLRLRLGFAAIGDYTTMLRANSTAVGASPVFSVGHVMLNPDDDEILYTSSPAMFRSRPILFMLAVASIAIGIGLIVLPLWWWRCRSVRITVTRQKTILRKGIFSLYLNELQHVNVRNVQLRQTFFQRIMNVGTIGISSSGQAGIEIEVDGIPDPMRVKRLIESGGKQSGVVSATRRVVEQTSSPAVANEAYPFRSRRESNSVADGRR